MIPYGLGSNQFHLNYQASNNAPNNKSVLKDYGPDPFSTNIKAATLQNDNFRISLWTGEHFQITLMSLKPGEDIGLEMHPDVDQFLRLEQGQGMVTMGKSRQDLSIRKNVSADDIIVVPAGTWHNLTNTGSQPLKLYSIYAPAQHPYGTVYKTKQEEMNANQ